MTTQGWLQILFYIFVLVLLVKPLGLFMAKVYQDERTFLTPIVGPLERFVYRLAGIRPDDEMDWKVYAIAVLLFSVVGFVFLYILQRLQGFLPLNPAGMSANTSRLVLKHGSQFCDQHQLAGLRRRN